MNTRVVIGNCSMEASGEREFLLWAMSEFTALVPRKPESAPFAFRIGSRRQCCVACRREFISVKQHLRMGCKKEL